MRGRNLLPHNILLPFELMSTICCLPNRIQEVNSILFEPNPNEVDITHFELRHLLGGGGFGVVQYATKLTDHDKHTDYAIKSISKSSVIKRSTGFVSIYAELKILTLLNHPFICNAHYAFQDRCYVFLVLDLARAGDMRYNLSLMGGIFPEELAKFYICQVIIALEHCHKLRIIHRTLDSLLRLFVLGDIKPENILLNDDGYIKLTDFGVSKFLSPYDDCRSTSGTHGYMAPEIYIGPTHSHGTPADWFALGVTLHEFVIGKRPFETKKIKMCQNFPENLPLKYLEVSPVSPGLKSFLSKLLCTQPFRRLRGGGGPGSLRSHEWLRNVNWDHLSQKMISPPYLPSCTQQFQCVLSTEEATELMKRHLEADVSIPNSEQIKFQKYAYRNILIPKVSKIDGFSSVKCSELASSEKMSICDDESADIITVQRILFTIITSNSPKISEESTISNSPLPPRSMAPAPFPTSSSGERSQSKKSSSHLGNGFPSLWELGKRVLKGDISTSTTLSSSQNPSSTLASVVNHKVQHQVDSLSSSSSKLKSPMKIVLEDTE